MGDHENAGETRQTPYVGELWYCTTLQLPGVPGWVQTTDGSVPLLIQCTRVSQAVVDDNGLSIARLFRALVRIADSIP